tara:strand:- start:396 stop:626 length:231 start_codon:yes stop_codon:yes gene_type:complete
MTEFQRQCQVLLIGSLVNELADTEVTEYARLIAFYKDVRHLVQGGQLRRPLLPELDAGISAWQFTAEDGSEPCALA